MVYTVVALTLSWAMPLLFIYHMQKQISNRKLGIALAIAVGTSISLFFTTVLLMILLLA